jgi:hypothetical protein
LPAIQSRFEMFFMPLAMVLQTFKTGVVTPERRAKLQRSLVHPLQQVLAQPEISLESIMGAAVMNALQEEFGIVSACIYALAGGASPPAQDGSDRNTLVLCFTLDVLPAGAATNEEAPLFVLAFSAVAAAPPLSKCLVPWAETPDAACPRSSTTWNDGLRPASTWTWSGAAFIDPIKELDALPVTHYVPLVPSAAVDSRIITWPVIPDT